MIRFQVNDLSLETQWRAIVLFGRNSATYKFAFAKSLLDLVDRETTRITLSELAVPFSKHIITHLRVNDKQGNASSSKFLNACREFIRDEITESELHSVTERLGFVNVVNAFQNVNGDVIPDPLYEKNYDGSKKEIIVTDNLLKLKESNHYKSFYSEVEARWNLVETAWNLDLNPKLLEVKYDDADSLFYLENSFMRRTNITSVRDSLNGYQKGKCFYSFQDISISIQPDSEKLCDVDHFLPHQNKQIHYENEVNINGVWNLVLANKSVNREKSARIPHRKYLQRLFNRNEFYIDSKHPLAETIINQTGKTKERRKTFLEKQYNLALQHSIHIWKPSIELIGSF